MTVHEERELKLNPGPTFRMPAFDGLRDGLVATHVGTRRLRAAYYDTPDLRLARAGASLRYRDDDGWTVKLPGGGTDLLTRHEHTVRGEPGDPPPEARELVLAIVRHEPLQLVGRLHTVREPTVVRDTDGRAVAEIVDDEVSVLDGARLVARFRELEVELADDTDGSVAAELAARLRAAGAGAPDPTPKIVRALGPRALEPPDVVPELELDEASTPVEILQGAIAASTARLVAHDPGVRLGTDAEAVHQARVATRKLRSDLRTFRRTIDEVWAEGLRAELRWLGGLLGDVRDTDVLLERLRDRITELPDEDAPAGERLLGSLVGHRDAARLELLAAMRSDRYLSLLDRLVDATHSVPRPQSGSDAGLEPLDLVRRPWRRLRRAVRALDEDPADAELHAVRILAKRCRYAAEAVSPAVGRPARRFARRLAALQDVLGEHQDAVIAERWLREHAPADDAGAAFVAGELASLEVVAAETSRLEWRDVWRAVRRTDLARVL